jgi:hypothetical protein
VFYNLDLRPYNFFQSSYPNTNFTQVFFPNHNLKPLRKNYLLLGVTQIIATIALTYFVQTSLITRSLLFAVSVIPLVGAVTCIPIFVNAGKGIAPAFTIVILAMAFEKKN